MCCRLDIRPLDTYIASTILQTGMFEPANSQRSMWRRRVDEEGATVLARFETGHLVLSIAPGISNMSHHEGKRLTAGVYFEIAAKYVEKVNGTITQRATVMGCRPEHGPCVLLLARYPEMPISFERVCHGFQSVLLPPRPEEHVISTAGAWLHHENHGGHNE